MIITDPAVVVLQETFAFATNRPARFRLGGARKSTSRPFTSQAYAEAAAQTAHDGSTTPVRPVAALVATRKHRS